MPARSAPRGPAPVKSTMEPTPATSVSARRALVRRRRRGQPAHPDGGWAIDPAWLTVAIEHAADGVVITDGAGTIQYVNAALERMMERPRADLLGRHTWALQRGVQPSSHYRAMAATVREGRVWQGEFIHRRTDGSHLHTDATVAPVRDATGRIVGAVAVQRDVTGERALQAQLVGQREERAELAAALRSLRAGETADATAAAVVAAVARLPGLRGAGLWSFEPDGDASPLASVHGDRPLPPLGPLPAGRVAHLRERSLQGPWIEAWQPRADHPYNAFLTEQGISALAYVPVQSGVDTLGLLIVAGHDAASELAERMPALVECASVAGALLGPQLRARHRQRLGMKRIRAIIEAQAFAPVFQPIVELGSRTLVGCEALTRFTDGSAPERIFAEAAACGLSVELEAATLAATLAAARDLPASVWLNLNVSAEFVLAGEPLASLLCEARAPVVLELTEHAQVGDYVALRGALGRLGANVRLAVDDAGAGFASFRHILELAPDYVKLDRALVHAIGRDPARQALVAGLVHFAARTGATLIAEGVETEAEDRQLAELGVSLAQGYHLGRPVRVGTLARRAGIGTVPRGRRPAPRQTVTEDDIVCAVNIGIGLAAALRSVGIATLAELRAIGAVPAWERLRQTRPRLATRGTLLKLEGASRGVRPARLPPAESERLMSLARIERQEAP